jgi:hypothetical protein
VSIDASPPAQPPQMSPDGNWVWDGTQWQPVTAVEPSHEGVFAAYAQKVEAADQTVAVAEPAAVAVPVQATAPVAVAAPAVDYPYPAPAPAADYYPPAESVIPLWQQQPSSGKTIYLYVGGAVVLFLMVLIVLNTFNFLSLPFMGGQTSSNSPRATKPSPAPSPVSRSEFARADAYINGPLTTAILSFNRTLPAWQGCNGDSLSTSCFNTITTTDQELTNLILVIDHAAIPSCIAGTMTKFRYDLGVMEDGIKLGLQGYRNNSLNDLTTGLYHFRRFGAFLQSDLIAIDNAKSSQCSRDLEGP